jgi:tol-pal system protein YbgF
MDHLATDAAAMQKRIDAIDQYLNLEGTSSKSASQTASQPKSTSDQKLYDGAKKAFDDGNLKDARNGFAQLINDYPKSPHADNSQFWIGETYYQEKWYEKAILEYQKVIENYPTGNKVPAALLKQGLSFINIGEPNNARLVLKELTAKYPSTNEATIAKRKLATLN